MQSRSATAASRSSRRVNSPSRPSTSEGRPFSWVPAAP
jgi:hypothetical protein